MKRTIMRILTPILFVVLLTACADPTASKWQEQYDLGMRYLNEEKYDEAIIAFQAAIEIEPKRAETYVGIAKAYLGISDDTAAVEWLQKGMEQAEDTSEIVVMLAELSVETPKDMSGDISDETSSPLNSIEQKEMQPETIAVNGTLAMAWETESDGSTRGNLMIYFDEPVTAEVDGNTVTLTEAALAELNPSQAFDFYQSHMDALEGPPELTRRIAVSATGWIGYMDYREIERQHNYPEGTLLGDGAYNFVAVTIEER